MSAPHDHDKVIARRVGEEICHFANGTCDCKGRERLCARVENEATRIMTLVSNLKSEGRDNG